MSLPFYAVGCSGCSYTQRYSFDVWYEFEGGRDAECQPKLTQGWCTDCQAVVTISGPFTQHDAQTEISELEDFKQRERRGFLFKLGFSLSKPRQEHIRRFDERISQSTRCAEYFRSIDCPERCLTCGGTSVRSVKLPSNPRQPVPILITHDCGGFIRIKMEGRISYGELPKVVYDIFGRVLRDGRVGDG